MNSVIYAILIFILGIVVSGLMYLLINNLARSYIKKRLTHKDVLLTSIINDAMHMMAVLCSIIIFFVFTFYAINRANLANSLSVYITSLIPKILVITLILIIALVMMRVIRSIFKHLRYNHIEILSIFLQVMIAFASILTTLEYLTIQATAFLEIFKVVLYTIGLTIALSLGISIGLSIQGKIKKTLFGKRRKKR